MVLSLLEFGDQVVHHVVATGAAEEHVHREHLAAGRDEFGVNRVADPVAGLGVLVAGRVREHRENLGRCGGNRSGDDVSLSRGCGHLASPFGP